MPNLENDTFLKLMINNIPIIKDCFNIVGKLGEGTFSKVYRAKLKLGINAIDDDKEYAIKYIIPIVKPPRITRELRFLRDLGGKSNIIPVRACFHNAGHTVFVMPIVEHDKFIDYFQLLSVEEVREYMRNLLISLEFVHSHRIIHRDIKPSNFLYNRSTGHFALVDFGLSQYEEDILRSTSNALINQFTKSKTNEHQSKNEDNNLKRTFNDMNCTNLNKCDNIQEISSKRIKINEQSSVFISPVTPSVIKTEGYHYSKIRSPLIEDKNIINIVNVSQSSTIENNVDDQINKTSDSYKTPTKARMMLLNANKTPVKNNFIELETPPKTVQKNLYFNQLTPTSSSINIHKSNKENFRFCNRNKTATIKKFQFAPKNLQPELSATNQNNVSSPVNNECECMKKDYICQKCLSKIDLVVPRAGTPGFRAPEILLRSQNQSTKIDIWSSGVIFASLLSGRYPFFRCTDDITCLAEIITVIGSSRIKKAAAELGKTIIISRNSMPPMNLRKICINLKKSSSLTMNENSVIEFPEEAYDLLKHLLDPNPFTRYSATQALRHPFFN